jgi:3-oxoacyl-[acyl-carrier protein] reductase
MDLGLEGARVLVTAASKGLGAAAAQRFSLEGARVVINSRSLGNLQETAAAIAEVSGLPVHVKAADVTVPEQVAELVAYAADTLGGLDILVTNAGGPPSGGFDDFDLAAWQQATDLTLLSAVNLIQEALPHLRRSERAAILTITSVSAAKPIPNLILSNVIRPAVIALTRSLALELGPESVRANSILPGTTDTDRVRQLMEDRAADSGATVEEEYEKAGRSNPLGRIAQPDEFANAAVFLCSPAASFINGVALLVDGGAAQA